MSNHGHVQILRVSQAETRMMAGERCVDRIAKMSERHTTRLSELELRRIHVETGVDVYALLDLMARTPTERLNIAMANSRNMAHLRAVTSRAK